MVAARSSLLHFSKRADIFFSAMKALMILRPPRVSSICDVVSPSFCCATSDFALSLRPIEPITQPSTGMTQIVKSVSSQLMYTKVPKYITMNIGFLMSMSREVTIEFSTSETSPVIRAMMSPLRSFEKKPIGKLTTLSYTFVRISRTIPVRNGMIAADEPK